jgi:hypothetical protein
MRRWNSSLEKGIPMNERDALKNFVWNPLAWAADCRAQARFKTGPEAQAAFLQLAEEFEATANEIVGLIATVEALSRRKRSARASTPNR